MFIENDLRENRKIYLSNVPKGLQEFSRGF